MLIGSNSGNIEVRLRRSKAFLLFLISTFTEVSSSFSTLSLHPTAEKVNERRRRRSLQQVNETHRYLKHSRNSAVYATLSDEDEDGLSDEEQDFHRYRHLSRYERALRERQGWDLQLNWNGTYSHQVKRRLRDEGQIRHGGSFDHYQAVPLAQGYGTHYAHLWVGTPKAQRKSVIIDTGSHYTAFPCKGCNNCGEEHHTDPYFDPGLSTSFRSYTCDDCHLGATCQDNKCAFSQSYTEGSSWEAYQVEDILHLGGNDILSSTDPSSQGFSIPFMFGCQTSENGLFVTQLADGIMGMSAHDMTITKQLYDKKKIPHKLFSLCFRRELGTSRKGVTAGVMTLGGMDTRMDTSPMIFAKNTAPSGWFTVYVNNILIRVGGGQSATSKLEPGHHVFKIPLHQGAINSGKGVIVDSGTTDTYLHKKLAKSFVSVWKQVTKKEYTHNGIALTDDQMRRLPTILVQCRAFASPSRSALEDEDIIGYAGSIDPLSPYDLLIAIPASNYMEYSPTTNLYTSRLYFTETQGGVLGANAMQGHNVVFDWENGRVGFAESSCAYEDKNAVENLGEANFNVDETHSVDCNLKPPILSLACVESVDRKMCIQRGGTKTVLQGKEMWTYLVENPGTSHGLACTDVVLLASTYLGPVPPKTECDGFGVCMEYRPCEVDCSELVEKENVVKESSTEHCPGPYSACDFECTQTVLSSLKKSDGNCHELSRSTRPCHKDACGGNDPCRVPYLVQASIGFRGAKRDLWFPYTEELLSGAIVNAVHRKLPASAPFFEIGDIKIMMVSRWFDQNDAESSTAKELGVKVVIQISFFNPNAKMVTESDMADSVDDTGEEHERGRNRLTNVASNVKTMLHRPPRAKTVCVENDLYSLASKAHVLHRILEEQDFLRSLIDEVKKLEGGDQNFVRSPFSELYINDALVFESLVFSSWTVRTEIDETYKPSNGVVPKRLRQFAFNWNFLVAFSCMTLFGIGWACEHGSTRGGTRCIGRHSNATDGDQLTNQNRRPRQAVDDEELFTTLFHPNGTANQGDTEKDR